MELAVNIRAIICQRLMPDKKKKGLVPAVEIMLNTPAITKLIREDRIGKIPAALQLATKQGMQTFNQSLVTLLKEDRVTLEEALAKASNPEALKMHLKGIYLDEERKIFGESKEKQ